MSIRNLFKPNIEKLKAKKNLQGLIKALNYYDEVIRIKSAKALGEIADKETVKPIINALKDRDPNVRKQAAWALGNIGNPRATDSLVLALEDCYEVRLEAIKALGRIKDEGVVETLILMLIDDDDKIRTEASKSIKKIGQLAFEALVKALRHEDNNIRYNSAEILDRMHWQPKDEAEKEYYIIAKRKWNELPRRIEAQILRFIILTMQDKNESVQNEAHTALLKFGPQVVEPLIELLNDESPDIKKTAAKVLGEIGDTRAAKPLESIVYKNNMIEWEILWALAKIKKDFIEHLIQLLGDEKEELRLSAVKALSSLGDDLSASGKRLVEPLVQLLHDTNEVSRVRNPARLLRHDTNEKIKAYTIKALCNIGSLTAINPVIKLLVNESAADHLYFSHYLCDNVSLRVALEAFKKRSDFRGRCDIAERIAKLASRETIDHLAEAMVDESQYWKGYGTGIKEMFADEYSLLVGKEFTKKRTYRNEYGAIESDGGFFAALRDWEESHGPKVSSTDLLNGDIKMKTKKIGNQEWMAKNLDISTFRNGDPIPEMKTTEEWKMANRKKEPAWCYYENSPENGKKYGILYNWFAVVDPRGLAPEGWHVPSLHEFNELLEYYGGGGKNAYNALKQGGSSGFCSLFGGQCSNYGASALSGVCACYWSTTQEDKKDDISLVWALIFDSRDPCAIMFSQEPSKGLSVRCLKD